MANKCPVLLMVSGYHSLRTPATPEAAPCRPSTAVATLLNIDIQQYLGKVLLGFDLLQG